MSVSLPAVCYLLITLSVSVSLPACYFTLPYSLLPYQCLFIISFFFSIELVFIVYLNSNLLALTFLFLIFFSTLVIFSLRALYSSFSPISFIIIIF